MHSSLAKNRNWKGLTAAFVLMVTTAAAGLFMIAVHCNNNKKKHLVIRGALREMVTNTVQFAKDQITDGIGAALSFDSRGLPVVQMIRHGGPAEEVGLQEGNVIVAINRVATKGKPMTHVVDEIQGLSIGNVMLLTERDGTNRECTVYRKSWSRLNKLGFQ